jgi:3-hydroxybutyryl-CoA dehydrogenase
MKVIIISEKDVPGMFPRGECVVVRTVAEAEGHRGADLFIDLEFVQEEARVAVLSRLMPSPVIVGAVSSTIAEIGRPFVRMNSWPVPGERMVHELVAPDADMAARLGLLYERLGRGIRWAPDIPGMITARVLAAIINEAWYTWQDGVSSKEEIDTAMRLGTNYPMGPFAWGELIGLSRVVQLLDKMVLTESRYVVAESLKMASGEIKI